MNDVLINTPTATIKNKYRFLFLGLLFDAIGMLSFVIPFVGEFSDIIWAPISGLLLKSMYKGKVGKIGGLIAFFEEALPGLDIIPTFTIVWCYSFLVKKKELH